MSCNTPVTGNSTVRHGTAEVGDIMADAPLTLGGAAASDDQPRKLQEEAAEDNGNGNNDDDDSRSGDDGSGLFGGTDGTGSDADGDDGGFDADAAPEASGDGGLIALSGGDQPTATAATRASAAAAASALAAMTLTGAAAAAGKAEIAIEAEDEAIPAAIVEAGTATSTAGRKVVLRQGKLKLAMPIEVLGGICKFLPYGIGAAGATKRSITGVLTDCLNSSDEKDAFSKAHMNGNFSALQTAYVLCQSPRTRKVGIDLFGEWEKHNEKTVAEYFEAPIAEALRSTYTNIFRFPHHAISMDHPALLLRAIRKASVDVFGDDPCVRDDDGSIACEFGFLNLTDLAMTTVSPKCLSALLDLAADAARPALTHPNGSPYLHSVIMKIVSPTSTCPSLQSQLQLAEVILHHEVCDVNVRCDRRHTALQLAVLALWHPLHVGGTQNRCLAAIAMLVKAGADVDRQGGNADGDAFTPQDLAMLMTESDDEAVVARGALALEVLNGHLLVNEDISGIIAKANALAGILSFL